MENSLKCDLGLQPQALVNHSMHGAFQLCLSVEAKCVTEMIDNSLYLSFCCVFNVCDAYKVQWLLSVYFNMF